MSAIRGALKIVLFLIWTLLVGALQVLIRIVPIPAWHYIFPKLWHRVVCLIFCLRITVSGNIHCAVKTLYVSNHLSYLDIPVLGSVISNVSFVAKKDVAGWPVFGFLATLQNTVFFDRNPRKVEQERDKVAARLQDKQSLIIFPEATSTDGVIVKPFKSSLFSLAAIEGVMIQPVTITLRTINGDVPTTIEQRRIYTWPLEDDIEMPTHLWRLACSSGAEINVHFHDCIDVSDFDDRKALAKTCENIVSMWLNNSKGE